MNNRLVMLFFVEITLYTRIYINYTLLYIIFEISDDSKRQQLVEQLFLFEVHL